MTAAPHQCWTQSEQSAVREQLDRILASPPFAQSKRRQRFLEFIVNETVAGRGDRLKGYTIALEVFDRSSGFDSNVDPIVRIEAGKLRDKLREYYETEGHEDPVRIDLPKGSYAPHIEVRPQVVTDTALKTNRELAHAANGGDALPNRSMEGVIAARFSSSVSMRWQLFGVLAAAVILIALAIGSHSGNMNALRTIADKPSVAVLPFDNIGHDAKWERLADGLTEDIITDLAHSKDLIVIARNSTEVFKDKPVDIRAVGRDLNVKYVLEGSIQSVDERIRVSAQLIDATSGSHVWSERFDRPATDLFAVQNEVTGKIAATLIVAEGAVAEAERELLRRKPPANLTAFDTYLLAMEAKHKVTKESLEEAERLFNKAIELDPHLARAYYGLATVQMYLVDLGLTPVIDDALSKMMTAARKSVELDPDDGNSHLALGGAYGYAGKIAQATAELNKAESLSPSDADLLLVIAWSLCTFGETQRALTLADRALQLNPHYADWYNQGLAIVYFFGEQHDQAVKYGSLIREPMAPDYAYLAMANAYLGRTEDAKAATDNVIKLDPAWNAERYLGERGGYPEKQAELFVEGARKAGLPACVAANVLQKMPDLVRVKSCDAQRANGAG